MFKVSARAVLELGSELISSDIIAFYELVKNGFDAKTKSGVEIRFEIVLRKNKYLSWVAVLEAPKSSLAEIKQRVIRDLVPDAPPTLLKKAKQYIEESSSLADLIRNLDLVYDLNRVIISDTGTGMSLSDLTDKFLVIGTPSRKKDVDQAIQDGVKRVPYLGEKGLGRLSAMRLGNRLHVSTARAIDKHFNILEIDWTQFSELDLLLEDIELKPKRGGVKEDKDWSGTRITISSLTEDWTKARVEGMADLEFAKLTDPFLDQKRRPKIFLYWNNQRISIPLMSHLLLDHANATAKGRYTLEGGIPRLDCEYVARDIGKDFEHPVEVDPYLLAGVDLVSLISGPNEEIHESALIRVGSFDFEIYWFNRQRLQRIDSIGDQQAVRDLQKKWSGIMLFRDGFRVLPYGDEGDDWLELDRRALSRSGYLLNKLQFIGRVSISRAGNRYLEDQTNREGLRHTPEQQVLVGLLKHAIQKTLGIFLDDITRRYKEQPIDLSDANPQAESLERRAKTALRQLSKIVPKDSRSLMEEIEQMMLEFSQLAERARERVGEIERENQQMVEMAGVGLMVEVIAHELARASENAMDNLEALKQEDVPREVRQRLESLYALMKSLRKRIRILDPLSVAGRQRSESFDLDELIRDIIASHSGQFLRHGITVNYTPTKEPVRVKAVKGQIVQVLENLISNSKYWLQMKKQRRSVVSPAITIRLSADPPTIVFEDNGTGIAIENRDKVFLPFFSLKEASKRRGLGLFIARECAKYNKGDLVLDHFSDPETGRLHRFILTLPQGGAST